MKNSKSKNYVNRVKGVCPNNPIFSAKGLKAIIDCVQKEAKKKRLKKYYKTSKTTELMVLLLNRGLAPSELLNLNIADLPCHHGKNSIMVVHNSWGKGTTREVYLYDGNLETKLNEFVQKYRQGVNPYEPLFISRHGNRSHLSVLSGKLRRLSKKLGIKPLSAPMFRRTVRYQIAGLREDTRKKRPIGATLKVFFERYVRPKLSKRDIEYHITRLYTANQRKRITLYELKPYKSGQAKRFSVVGLILWWHQYQEVLTDLPDLCQEAISKDKRLRPELSKESEKSY